MRAHLRTHPQLHAKAAQKLLTSSGYSAALLPRPCRSRTAGLVHRPARDRDEVDAVAVARAVGQVVPEMRAVGADALAVGQHAHVLPVDLRVAERGPAVHPGLLHERVPVAIPRAEEERLARVAVVERDLSRRRRLLRQKGGLPLPVAAVLGVVAVVVADAVGRIRVAVPPQILLTRQCAGAVPGALVSHHLLGAHHHGCAEVGADHAGAADHRACSDAAKECGRRERGREEHEHLDLDRRRKFTC